MTPALPLLQINNSSQNVDITEVKKKKIIAKAFTVTSKARKRGSSSPYRHFELARNSQVSSIVHDTEPTASLQFAYLPQARGLILT